MKIRNKLLLSILSTVLIISASMIYLSYVSSRKTMVAEIGNTGRYMLDRYLLQLDGTLEKVQAIAEAEGIAIENLGSTASEEDVINLIQRFVKSDPEVYGSTISFVPQSFGKKRLFGPYYHKSPQGLVYVDLAVPSYDYPKWDWFKIPLETGKPYWSPPYMDVGGGGVAMTTYSFPFFKNGKVWGISTIDISLKKLTDIVDNIKIGQTGFAFLIDNKGTFLTLRRSEDELKTTIFDAAKKFGSADLEQLGRDMTNGKKSFASMFNPLIDDEAWFAYGPLSTTGWSLAIVMPEDELMADLTDLHRNSIIIAATGLIIIFAMVFLVSSKIVKPISILAESAQKIAAGDFFTEIKLPPSKDEVGYLTKAFTSMKNSLAENVKQLYEEKEMFKVAFSQMSDGLVILDEKCNVIQYNKFAEKILMLPTTDPLPTHLGRYFESSIPLSGVSCIDKQLSFKLTRHETNELGVLHLECTVSPILDESGTIKEHVLSVRNITEQEKEELSKRNFLSLMSHKLFTPLTVLQGKLMLMKDGLLGPLDEKQLKQVVSMADQTGKLKELIESLVNFVALEESKFDTTKELIELPGYLALLADEVKSWHPDKNPEVAVNIEPDLQTFLFNKKLLGVLVKQLIDNGLKFNMNSQARITLDCKKEGKQVIISVTDNGLGIPPEFIDKIFDKFYQIDKYFTGNVEGVGLGLAYVKEIVNAFQGSINVQSESGKGSTFTVKFPV